MSNLLKLLIIMHLYACHFTPKSSDSSFKCEVDGVSCDSGQSLTNSPSQPSTINSIFETFPNEEIDSSQSSTIASLKTTNQSICRYDYLDNEYQQMSYDFVSDISGKTHQTVISLVPKKSYSIYIKCVEKSNLTSVARGMITFATTKNTVQEVKISNLAPMGRLNNVNASLNLQAKTSLSSQCRYATEDTSFLAMTKTFVSFNQIDHTAEVLVSPFTNYEFFIKCMHNGIVTSQSSIIRFQVENLIDKTPPQILTTGPTGSHSGETTSITLQASTNELSLCRYSESDQAYNLMANNLNSDSLGTTHTKAINVVENKNYSFYVRCQDRYANNTTTSAKINFRILQKEVKDITPPVISALLPAGAQNADTREVSLSLNTSEQSACRYGEVDAPFNSLPTLFNTQNGISHSRIITVEENKNYAFFVRCSDIKNNQTPTSSKIIFNIKKSIPTDSTAPALSQLIPHNQELDQGIKQTTLSLVTDENAQCRFSSNSSTAFLQMDLMQQTSSKIHQTPISGLENGMNYQFYVKCQDQALNISVSTQIAFSIKREIILDGLVLYKNNCKSCHSPLAQNDEEVINQSDKRGTKFRNIKDGIMNVSQMNTIAALSLLTDEQIQLIASVLEESAVAPPPPVTAGVLNSQPVLGTKSFLESKLKYIFSTNSNQVINEKINEIIVSDINGFFGGVCTGYDDIQRCPSTDETSKSLGTMSPKASTIRRGSVYKACNHVLMEDIAVSNALSRINLTPNSSYSDANINKLIDLFYPGIDITDSMTTQLQNLITSSESQNASRTLAWKMAMLTMCQSVTFEVY